MECNKMGEAPVAEQTDRPGGAEARAAVYNFLSAVLPDAQRVDITKVVPVKSGVVAWELEAQVWRPDATLKMLGVESGRTVLEHDRYSVRLDAMLSIVEYEQEADWQDLRDEENGAFVALGELHRRLETGQIDEKEFNMEERRLLGEIGSLENTLRQEHDDEGS